MSGRAGLAMAACVLVALTACTPGVTDARDPGDTDQAQDRLRALRTAPEGDGAGYERERFGTRWKDIDGNDCDQRNDVLARDLDRVRKRGRCVVVGGLLRDPYGSGDITFAKSQAAEVQIDHLYPLALAWRMGAARWPADRRERFANDHDNLLAVGGDANRRKSDSGPGEWLPPRDFRCRYAVRYVAVAVEYDLAVTRGDRGALRRILGQCSATGGKP